MSGFDVSSAGTPPTGDDPGYDAMIEEVLAGRIARGPEDDMTLVSLVDALRAPGSEEELAGADAAASAFVAARSGAAVVPLASRRAGRAAVAVAAVLGGVVLLGGTAAAATGALPDPVQDLVHRLVPAFPSSSGSADETASNVADPSSSAPGKPSVSPISATAPEVGPLCQAFAGRTDSAATGSTTYQRLLLAAQKENLTIAAWCSAHAPARPSTKPSNAGKPTDAGKPSDAGKPTDAGKPSTVGKPSTQPKPSHSVVVAPTPRPAPSTSPKPSAKPSKTAGARSATGV